MWGSRLGFEKMLLIWAQWLMLAHRWFNMDGNPQDEALTYDTVPSHLPLPLPFQWAKCHLNKYTEMRGLGITHAFIHPGGGYHSGISPHRIKLSRRELREGKLNSPLLWVSLLESRHQQEWWAMVNKTPWGIHRSCIHPPLSSHSRLFCLESSNNRKFGSGGNQWVTRRGTRWRLWWGEK